MNNMKWISAVLLAVLISAPVFAQTDKKINKGIDKAVKEAMVQASRQEAQEKTCAYCGKKITEEGQHCSAQDCTSLCRDKKITHKHTTVHSQENKDCAQCREELDMDEYYHEEKPACCATDPHANKHCIYCGEEIKSSDQKCSVSKGVCTISCPECNANLRNQANLDKNGIHHCRFKTEIKPVAAKK